MAIGAEIPFGWSVRSRRAIDDRFITADLTTRDALSTFRRHKNLEVFVESTNRSYYLDNDTTNSDWMEVLKSIDVLTEDSNVTDDDFLVWFDESEKTHKKVKRLNFKVLLGQLDQGGATTGQAILWNGTTWEAGTVSGSKWTENSFGIRYNPSQTFKNVAIGIIDPSEGYGNYLRIRTDTTSGTPFGVYGSSFQPLFEVLSSANPKIVINEDYNFVLNTFDVISGATGALRMKRIYIGGSSDSPSFSIDMTTSLGHSNVGLNGRDYQNGVGIFYIGNASTVPSTNPSNGGILYTDAGALKYRGSSGTVTTIANA